MKWEQDGSLTFRRSCAHGVCGSDAMRINGRNRLACKSLIKDLNPDQPITVEPIKGLPVLKDLIVDMEPFFQAYRDVMPFLVTTGNEPTRERLQIPGGARTLRRHHQVHPVRRLHDVLPGVLGRRPVLRARRRSSVRTGSSSTAATRPPTQRLEILNDREGVWRCRTTFNCTEACPRGIEVTKAIQEVKRALIFRRV